MAQGANPQQLADSMPPRRAIVPKATHVAWIKVGVFALCLVPAGLLVWDIAQESLGTDPIAAITHRSGDWTLRFLLITLAITPLRRFTGWTVLLRFRRMLGLFAFFYASLHFATYLILDLGSYWEQLFADILKRPYITVGFAAWLLLVPLALTSTKGMMRRLGRNWQRLHRLVYVIGVLGVLHYIWLVKTGRKIATQEPYIYAAILAILLLARLPWGNWWQYARRPHGPQLGTTKSDRS